MTDEPEGPAFDPQALVARFRERAEAVRNRGLPPVEGPERQRFRRQAQVDYMDFAMLGDAEATLDGGILTLRVDLRPPGAAGPAGPADPPGPAGPASTADPADPPGPAGPS